MSERADFPGAYLTAEDLLAGSALVHEIRIPPALLSPGTEPAEGVAGGRVRMRPLDVATLILISKAAREDASLVPLLMIKESLVEPELSLERIRHLHIGLVHHLVAQANLISGLSADGEALGEALDAPLTQTHLLLAEHFGWTPQQVSQLTPGQVAVYLAGVDRLLQLAESGR